MSVWWTFMRYETSRSRLVCFGTPAKWCFGARAYAALRRLLGQTSIDRAGSVLFAR
jgi:hypothetical protein